MLFRPFVLSHSRGPGNSVLSSSRARVAQKTRTAANNMNIVLEQIMDLDMVEFISPAMLVLQPNAV